MARILDGKAVEAELLSSLAAQVAGQPVSPSVAIILVGDDAGSRKYAQLKVDRSRKAGMDARAHNAARPCVAK